MSHWYLKYVGNKASLTVDIQEALQNGRTKKDIVEKFVNLLDLEDLGEKKKGAKERKELFYDLLQFVVHSLDLSFTEIDEYVLSEFHVALFPRLYERGVYEIEYLLWKLRIVSRETHNTILPIGDQTPTRIEAGNTFRNQEFTRRGLEIIDNIMKHENFEKWKVEKDNEKSFSRLCGRFYIMCEKFDLALQFCQNDNRMVEFCKFALMNQRKPKKAPKSFQLNPQGELIDPTEEARLIRKYFFSKLIIQFRVHCTTPMSRFQFEALSLLQEIMVYPSSAKTHPSVYLGPDKLRMGYCLLYYLWKFFSSDRRLKELESEGGVLENMLYGSNVPILYYAGFYFKTKFWSSRQKQSGSELEGNKKLATGQLFSQFTESWRRYRKYGSSTKWMKAYEHSIFAIPASLADLRESVVMASAKLEKEEHMRRKAIAAVVDPSIQPPSNFPVNKKRRFDFNMKLLDLTVTEKLPQVPSFETKQKGDICGYLYTKYKRLICKNQFNKAIDILKFLVKFDPPQQTGIGGGEKNVLPPHRISQIQYDVVLLSIEQETKMYRDEQGAKRNGVSTILNQAQFENLINLVKSTALRIEQGGAVVVVERVPGCDYLSELMRVLLGKGEFKFIHDFFSTITSIHVNMLQKSGGATWFLDAMQVEYSTFCVSTAMLFGLLVDAHSRGNVKSHLLPDEKILEFIDSLLVSFPTRQTVVSVELIVRRERFNSLVSCGNVNVKMLLVAILSQALAKLRKSQPANNGLYLANYEFVSQFFLPLPEEKKNGGTSGDNNPQQSIMWRWATSKNVDLHILDFSLFTLLRESLEDITHVVMRNKKNVETRLLNGKSVSGVDFEVNFCMLLGDIYFEECKFRKCISLYLKALVIGTARFNFYRVMNGQMLKPEKKKKKTKMTGNNNSNNNKEVLSRSVMMLQRLIHCLRALGEHTVAFAFEQFVSPSFNFKQNSKNVVVDNLKSFDEKWITTFWKMDYLELLMFISNWNSDGRKKRMVKDQIALVDMNKNQNMQANSIFVVQAQRKLLLNAYIKFIVS